MKTCCDFHNINCKQGDACPHRKVIQLHRVTELHEHFAQPHNARTWRQIAVDAIPAALAVLSFIGALLMASMGSK